MIDWGRVQELLSEVGEEDFAEVLPMFFEEVTETISGLEPSDRDTFLRDIHFLKGSAANIGMSDLSALCASIEREVSMSSSNHCDIAKISFIFHESKKALLQSDGKKSWR